MVDPNEQVIADAHQRGETLTDRELLLAIERHHRPEGTGVTHAAIDAYDEVAVRTPSSPLPTGSSPARSTTASPVVRPGLTPRHTTLSKPTG